MSGVCAFVPSEPSQLQRVGKAMVDRMAHYPWLAAAERPDLTGHAILGAVTFQPRLSSALASDSAGRFILAMDGEIFNASDEWLRLGPAPIGPEGRSDAALLITGWQRKGPAFLARLNGEFAAVLWDSSEQTLTLITDRFGLRPLFVARSAGGCAAASEVNALLEAPGIDRSWSPAGVSQFFSFGHFFNDETLLSGVRAVPAASCGTYRLVDRSYVEQSYWQPDTRRSTAPARDQAVAFEDTFIHAVERRAKPDERLGLSLSGGLDARAILGVAPAGRNLQTVSLGIEGSLDHKSAGALAAIAGVPHRAFMLNQDFLGKFEAHLREMVRLTSGHYLDQGIVMATMPIYRELGIDYLMRGHGGELLHMTKAYAFSLDKASLGASEAELDAWLLSHLTDYMLGGVPDDLFTVDVRGGARESLQRAIDRCQPTDQPIDRVWQLFINERLHRETTLSMHMFGCFAAIRQPYLDNDVIDVLLGMPVEMKLADALQTGLLRRTRPAFLDVINANTGARMGAGRLETAIATLRMKVGAKLGLKGYQPYERLGLWLKQDLRPLVEATVTSERLLSSGLFTPEAVRRVVSDHVDGRANHTFLIMSLMIFALGMELRD